MIIVDLCIGLDLHDLSHGQFDDIFILPWIPVVVLHILINPLLEGQHIIKLTKPSRVDKTFLSKHTNSQTNLTRLCMSEINTAVLT